MNNSVGRNNGGSTSPRPTDVPGELNEFGNNGRRVASRETSPGRRSGDLHDGGLGSLIFDLDNAKAWNGEEAPVDLTDNFDLTGITFGSNVSAVFAQIRDEVEVSIEMETLAMIKPYDSPRQYGWGLTDIRMHPKVIEILTAQNLLPLLDKYYPSSPYSAYTRDAKIKLIDALLNYTGFGEVEDFKVQNKLGDQDEALNTLAIIMGKAHEGKLHEVSLEDVKFINNLLRNDIAGGDWKLAMEICTALLPHPDKEVGNYIITIAQEAETYENKSHNITKDAWIAAKKKFDMNSLPERVALTSDLRNAVPVIPVSQAKGADGQSSDVSAAQTSEPVSAEKPNAETSNKNLALLILLLAILGGAFLKFLR